MGDEKFLDDLCPRLLAVVAPKTFLRRNCKLRYQGGETMTKWWRPQNYFCSFHCFGSIWKLTVFAVLQ